LKRCRKLVDAEIDKLKGLYKHDLLARAIAGSATTVPLSLPRRIPQGSIDIRGRAAAASNGVGITWIEDVVGERKELQVVLVTHDALEPVIKSGQYALVDGTGMPPQESDLAVIHAQDGSNYARRYWSDIAGIYLVGLNDVRPARPVTLTHGIHQAARIMGVLFDGPTSLVMRTPGSEWVAVTDDPNKLMKDTFGVRVTGASMDPVAKDGDIVLVRSVNPALITTGSLACVDIDEVGVVLKRCYRSGGTWILCPIGPASAEEPIITSSDRILNVFQLSGVLFASAMAGLETVAGSTPPRAA
jgi:hypothetical protein